MQLHGMAFGVVLALALAAAELGATREHAAQVLLDVPVPLLARGRARGCAVAASAHLDLAGAAHGQGVRDARRALVARLVRQYSWAPRGVF